MTLDTKNRTVCCQHEGGERKADERIERATIRRPGMDAKSNEHEGGDRTGDCWSYEVFAHPLNEAPRPLSSGAVPVSRSRKSPIGTTTRL